MAHLFSFLRYCSRIDKVIDSLYHLPSILSEPKVRWRYGNFGLIKETYKVVPCLADSARAEQWPKEMTIGLYRMYKQMCFFLGLCYFIPWYPLVVIRS